MWEDLTTLTYELPTSIHTCIHTKPVHASDIIVSVTTFTHYAIEQAMAPKAM